jgi:SepF-like predicted cell division protein (DUF552 family)
MFGRRKKDDTVKAPDGKKGFIDLESVEIDNDPTITRVRVIPVEEPNDLGTIRNQLGRGNIIIIEMSGFRGTIEDRERFADDVKTVVREKRSTMYSLNQDAALIADIDVKVDRLRIRREAKR